MLHTWNMLIQYRTPARMRILRIWRILAIAVLFQVPGRASGFHQVFAAQWSPWVSGLALLVLLSLVNLATLLWLVRRRTAQLEKLNRRLREEARIHRQTAHYLQLLDRLVRQASEGIVVVKRSGQIVVVNPAARRMLDMEGNDLNRVTVQDLQRGNPGSWADLFAAIEQEATWEGNLTIACSGCGDRLLNVKCVPLQDEGGEVGYLGLTMRDVTRQVEMEHQLNHRQKMELVGQLAGGVAHDFNNLLTVISGSAEMLRMKIADPDLERHLTQILTAGDRAASLVRQLLGFSRKQMIQPQSLDLDLLITEVGEMLTRLMSEDIVFQVEVSPGLPPIEADPGQIQQVLTNLVTNARDAVQSLEDPRAERLVRVEVRTDNLELTAASELGIEPGRYVLFSVMDTGPGMDEKTCSRIFEPFFTTKDVGNGTGLGLANVQGILAQNGGAVDVASTPGQGTVFCAYWPALPEAPVLHALNGGRSTMEMPGGKETILLVEDNTGVLSFARDALKLLGYRVMTASDGEEALERLKQESESIRLVVTDVVMPGMSGRDLAAAVRQSYPAIKVLFTSGHDERQVSRHGVSRNRAFLAKPYSARQLARQVRDVLDGER